MAGKRHHILPRFLLRGFASKEEGKNIYCWVFRKHGDPFEANITNVAVSKNFYSIDDSTEVDDAITDAEGTFASVVNNLRSLDEPTAIDHYNVISEFFAHLEVRTRHLRESLLESSNLLINELFEFFKDTEAVKKIILRKLIEDPTLLKNSLDKQFRGLNLPPDFKKYLCRLALSNAPKLIQEMGPQINVLAKMFSKELSKCLSGAIKDGHLKLLRETIAPEIRVESYQRLIWSLEIIKDTDLILGDFGVLIEINGSRRFKTFWEKGDKVRNVYLPISGSHLVVGRADRNSKICPHLVLVNAIAESSREFFVSRSETEENKILSQNIGNNSKIISDEEVRKTAYQFIENELKGNNILSQ